MPLDDPFRLRVDRLVMALVAAATLVSGLSLLVAYQIAAAKLIPPPSDLGRWTVAVVGLAALVGRLAWLTATKRRARSPRATTAIAVALSLAVSLVCVNVYWWIWIGSLYMDTEVRFQSMFPNLPSLGVGLVLSLVLSIGLVRSLAPQHD